MKLTEGNPHERETYIPVTDSPGVGHYIKGRNEDGFCKSEMLIGHSKSLVMHSCDTVSPPQTKYHTEKKPNSKYSLTKPLKLLSAEKI